jgi:two-component system, chemotaxis family, protein-glutamate methylesterase/glutaminase
VPIRDQSARVHAVAIGASAGGVEALRHLISALPADFPAAVLVVLHLPTHATSVLSQILARAGRLPAVEATDGAVLEGGHIYVAPPDCHLLVVDGKVCLQHGPRINGHRPAVDPLFKSVAATYGESGAGVVLSGVLDDGTAGLMAIKQAGGLTLAQDPAEALYEMMPRTAIEIVAPDHIGTAQELARVLSEQAAPLPPDLPQTAPQPPQEHLAEVDRGSSDNPQPGTATGLTCPECNGGIWLDESQGIPRFACRTGHAFSIESFAAAQGQRVEAALWTALRTLEERAALYRRMAARQRESGNARMSERWAVRAESAVQHGFVLREVIEQFAGGGREEGVA